MKKSKRKIHKLKKTESNAFSLFYLNIQLKHDKNLRSVLLYPKDYELSLRKEKHL